MASTRQKNGKWYYRITITSNGKNKYLERGSYDTQEEALEAGVIHEDKLKRGDIIFLSKIAYKSFHIMKSESREDSGPLGAATNTSGK